jgi:glycosyltransferase involved in cell wall biosynthesis
VAIDATSIPEKPAGAGVYAIELVRAMTAADPRDGYCVFTRGDWFDEATAGRKNWRVKRLPRASARGRLWWEQRSLPRELRAICADVLHSTHHTLPLRGVDARRVVTIHDVTFFRMPERYPLPRRLYMQTLTRLSARVADAVIVPSKTVGEDVERSLKLDGRKIHVVYEAAAERYRPVAPEQARAVARRYVDGDFVLSVGSLEPGKNRARLLEALRMLLQEGLETRLLIAGQPAWRYRGDGELVQRLGLEDRVTFAGYVPDADLPALYSAATAFAFPSLYEGYGLPVVEAMACGTPVLASNVSATAEVAGDAALLVDPLHVGAIHDGLRQLLTDAGVRERLRAAGLQRAAQFSWRRAADETVAVYRHVTEGV